MDSQWPGTETPHLQKGSEAATPLSLPTRQQANSVPGPNILLPQETAGGHFSNTPAPPPRSRVPAVLTRYPMCTPDQGRPLPQSLRSQEDSEGLTLFVISPFNPQMGQRLTLFGSGREKALTIICF